MIQERSSLVSENSSHQVDQCDPNTTVMFQPPANVVRKRWDPKTQKNLLIARPATRSEFQSWEIEKMVREAPRVEAPKIPGADDEETDPLPASLRYPPRYPTERAALAYQQWPTRPGTAAAHGRRTMRSPAFGATVSANYEQPPAMPDASFNSWMKSATNGGGGGGGGGDGGDAEKTKTGMSTVRLLHAPISKTEYVSRQQKRRPESAPPTQSATVSTSASFTGASSELRRTAGGGRGRGRGGGGGAGDSLAPAWRRSHFIASREGIGGEPTKATTWEEVKMRQRSGGGGGGGAGGVLVDAKRNNNGFGFGASSRRRGSRPATARARFHRKDDDGTDSMTPPLPTTTTTSAKENKLGLGASQPRRPASARFASQGQPSSSSSSSSSSYMLRQGTGRGGGQMPVDQDLVTELREARRAKVKVKPLAANAKKPKATSALGAIAASLDGGGGGGGGEAQPEPEGYKDGFRVQEMVPLAGHLERMREMARELDPRQQLLVARSMDKARNDIRSM